MVRAEVAPARLLAAAIEPIAGQAQFSPECFRAYEALGFPPSPGRAGRTALPDRSAFFTARGSVLGQVAPEVIAASFAVFNPEVVIPLVAEGFSRTDAPSIWAARHRGAVAQLERIIGENPVDALETADALLDASEALPLHGRPFFAAQRALEIPDAPIARLWRAADRLREYRGDSHIAVWTAEGLDATEIGLLSDLYWGLAPRSHTGGRGWTEAQLDEAEDRLRSRGFLDGERLSAAGTTLREAIEDRTDRLVAPAIAVLGDRLDAILATLHPWGRSIRDAGGYLTPLVRFTFGVLP